MVFAKSTIAHPTKWQQRRQTVHMEMKYKKANEEEKGILEVSYEGNVCARLETDKYRSGFVGFRWSNTKFVVTNLEVSGYLDQDWAKEALKKVGDKKDDEVDDDFDF